MSYTNLIQVIRIDNSSRGVVNVLWNFSRTKIATMSCDRSNERAFLSACVDANGMLMNLELKKRQIKNLSFFLSFFEQRYFTQ